MKPLVSISVVTYNHANYIKECLDGILMQQTTFPFEIILGEDHSNDGTREICIEYAEKHPDKIKLFLRSRKDVIYINGNPTGRYNMIENLKVSKGKYIALCEGDDYWTDPLKLQRQVAFLEANNDVNICFHRAQVLKEKIISSQNIPESLHSVPFNYIELLRHHNFIATASVMFRKPKKFIFPKNFFHITFGDMSLYKLVTQNKSIHCLDEVMCVYRVHERGIWSGLNEFNAQKITCHFNKLIFSKLNEEEKKITISKIKMVTHKMSRLKFPNNPLLQKSYNMYLRLKW